MRTLYFTSPFGLSLTKSLLKFNDGDNNDDDNDNDDDNNNDDGDNYDDDDDGPPVLLLHPDRHLHSESKVVRPISVSVIIVVQIILSYYNTADEEKIALEYPSYNVKEEPCVMMVPKWFSSAPLLGLHSSLHGVVQPAGKSVMSHFAHQPGRQNFGARRQ